MTLMSRHTGQSISDKEHLTQSIYDILMTPIGSRVAVRDYGCALSSLVDKPINRQWVMDSFISIATALDRWEPRYALNSVKIDASQIASGVISLTLSGLYKPAGRIILLENISLDFGVAA